VNDFDIQGAEMASETTVRLTAGNLRLHVNPSVGWSISGFEWMGGGDPQPILRKCHSRNENVLDASSFPLVPYLNRNSCVQVEA